MEETGNVFHPRLLFLLLRHKMHASLSQYILLAQYKTVFCDNFWFSGVKSQSFTQPFKRTTSHLEKDQKEFVTMITSHISKECRAWKIKSKVLCIHSEFYVYIIRIDTILGERS